MRFTENFIDLCEDSSITQMNLAKAIGVNQSQISRYLKGILPDVKTIVKICDYFNCSIDYIMGLSEEFNYKNLKTGFNNLAFYPEYERLLKESNLTHYALAKRKIVCETSLRLWKKGKLPNLEVIFNIALELGSSMDKLLGRI